MKFTHLHVHSHYSLLDGLAKIDQLVRRAGDLGFDALALTDHGVLYGAVEFYQKATRAGINPIIGCELYVAAEGMRDRRPGIDDKRFHLTVLAENFAGYRNLIQLATKAHLEGFYYKPRVDKHLLRQHAAGLIALSGCLAGEIPKAIVAKKLERAEALIKEYQEIFGKENFFLELGAHPAIPEQKLVNETLTGLSQKTGAKIVGVNDVHYVRSEDAEAQDILLSVQTGNRVEDEDRLTMRADDFSLKSTQEMEDYFRDLPEAVANTQEIAGRARLEIPLGKILLPPFPVPEGFSAGSYLEHLARRGLERRYGEDIGARGGPEARRIHERLAYELGVIQQTGFTSYFLIVQDFVRWARERGIVVGPGRGSAAGSLVSYLLGITNMDPLEYNLLFERFLNPERITMPDIDLDFSDRRRDEVIEYVAGKYGRDHVAQIITFGTMAARAAIRDTGRALGMPYAFCDQVAKLIPFHMGLAQTLEKVDDFRQLYQSRTDAKRLVDAAMKLEGVARHASTHACGVVIAPEPLTTYLPLQHATRSAPRGATKTNGEDAAKVIVTQYEMHAVEDLGLLKMDFLGLRNLTIIEDTVALIRQNHGIEINIEKIPLNDPETYRLFREGKTTGLFQFESAGMKRNLKELQPTELEDLIAMVALYRPGPMELIPSFIARKHGREKITYLHPKLEPILSTTHGIGVYQEQMMQIARDLAGFTLPEADTLRKAIGKKIRSLLEEQKEKLMSGMIGNGISPKTAAAIWELFPPFARYGFNRSHAACYALIAYQTAYLKAHFPAEFMAALMTNEGFEIERVALLVDEARALGLAILPPSVNSSNASFTVVEPAQPAKVSRGGTRAGEIRFGLGSVKNVGTNVVEAIIRAREAREPARPVGGPDLPDRPASPELQRGERAGGQAGGPFRSLDDFVERVRHKDLNKKSVESLVKCGALDELGERGSILANLDRILDYAREVGRSQAMGQVSLFGQTDIGRSPLRLEPAAAAEKRDRLAWEKELLGLYLSEHPLDEYRNRFAKDVIPVASLAEQPADARVKIGGLVAGIDRIVTKAGSPMLFVKLEDLTGKTEVLVFPRMLEKSPAAWQQDKILLVKGRVSRDRDAPKVLCDEVTEVV
ncbi:MAG: DNA polymerase III subunit alpha [Candidatus Sungbacteria bacterium RIFCSPLOWO2_01_FULL_59_16]|uniref:DNA polymerase III subunit alpha n=1 Tax=Candidatus Sungbacteria bacterium RIFCSPLOWO2_01_FULL_59_16 TaxID=1802280 RepID=A0A1G2LAV7_9BACT|nr:MAG: DNA polymerase III subunit alpha [Candidatus Sungbacteria bacterium RIFCSPLOWO2_01_FULL_59_16]